MEWRCPLWQAKKIIMLAASSARSVQVGKEIMDYVQYVMLDGIHTQHALVKNQ
jgi:hypothetical protein